MSAPSLGNLGRYTLLRRLAAGGMGEVYLAETRGAANFTRQVAIKRILPHLARDADFVHKFIDEANLMVQLHHGNIVPVQELADHDGELYIVMEYLPGRDLKAVNHRLRADGKRVPPELAVWLTTEILAGLDYAHRKTDAAGHPLNIVHRDVSPSNVLLGAGGEVKLADFGIARARGRLHKSISGTLQGKFVYMSPEQADGREVDPRSDVFSAALVLYELLCGVRPFEGESETETLRLVREAEVVAPSTIRGHLDPALDPLVLKALARDPAARYPSAGEMRRALQHYLGDRRSEADASTLAQHLETLFPEGVVPGDAPEAPMSLDDALQMQLGALTPSVDALTRTRTGPSDEHALVAARDAPPGVPAPTPRAASPEAPPMRRAEDRMTPTERARPKGRRRWLLFGLLLGVIASAAVMQWRQRGPGELQLRVTPAGLAHTVEVRTPDREGVLVQTDAQLEPGRLYSVCAAAPGHATDCERFEVEPGENHVRLHLVADAPPAVDAGTDAAPTPDAGPSPDTGPPDAAPAADAAARIRDAAPRPRPRPRRPRVRVDSRPTGAEVTRDGAPAGTTPVTLRRRGRYTFRAPGHEARTVDIDPARSENPLVVRLERTGPRPTGRIKARGFPPSVVIYLDGKRMGWSPMDEEVPAGEHEVRFVFQPPDGSTPQRKTTKITVRPGKTEVVTHAFEVDEARER